MANHFLALGENEASAITVESINPKGTQDWWAIKGKQSGELQEALPFLYDGFADTDTGSSNDQNFVNRREKYHDNCHEGYGFSGISKVIKLKKPHAMILVNNIYSKHKWGRVQDIGDIWS